jgi:hypothetical protein
MMPLERTGTFTLAYVGVLALMPLLSWEQPIGMSRMPKL